MKAIDCRALQLRMRLVTAREVLEEALNSPRRKLLGLQVPDGRKDPPQPHSIGVNRRCLVPSELFCFKRRLDQVSESQLAIIASGHLISS